METELIFTVTYCSFWFFQPFSSGPKIPDFVHVFRDVWPFTIAGGGEVPFGVGCPGQGPTDGWQTQHDAAGKEKTVTEQASACIIHYMHIRNRIQCYIWTLAKEVMFRLRVTCLT